jgi:arylformamidase
MPTIIDLSHTIEENMPVYPGTNTPLIEEVCSLKVDGFKESLFSFYSHIGTHLDVPAHIFKDGKTVEKFEPDKFFGKAIIIDCTVKPYIESTDVKQAYFSADKPEFILFYTNWANNWGNEKYFGQFPVLTNEAANFIATLSIKGIGIDAISFDPVEDHNLTNHKILLEKEIILVENLCLLNNLPKEGFHFSCLPLKIAGADGSPTRAFAIV